MFLWLLANIFYWANTLMLNLALGCILWVDVFLYYRVGYIKRSLSGYFGKTVAYLWLSCKNCSCCLKLATSLCQNCQRKKKKNRRKISMNNYYLIRPCLNMFLTFKSYLIFRCWSSGFFIFKHGRANFVFLKKETQELEIIQSSFTLLNGIKY